ncbi:MAG: endonuclease V [bacterium]
MSPLHPWPTGEAEAEAIQAALVGRCVLEPLATVTPETLIAGCDLAYDKDERRCYAVVVVTRDGGREVVATATDVRYVEFPYVPGLLSFREVPALLAAFDRLAVRPDVVLCDGQGIAHPRRFGLACHLGLWLDLPAVGCAKSRLIGTHAPLPEAPGSTPPWIDGVEAGALVRRIAGVKPVYVSPGHRCDVASAVALVRGGAGPYRIPEPVRLADLATRALRAATP